MVLQLFHKARDITRVRNQHVVRAGLKHDAAVQGKGINVVERQRRDNNLLTFNHHVFHHRPGLQQVGYQVAVGQHRAFRHTGRPAGVLKHGNVILLALYRGEFFTGAGTQNGRQLVGLGQIERRHHLFDMLDHGIHQRALDWRVHIRDFGNNHVLDASVWQHLLGVLGHVRENHQRLGSGIVELMFHFPRGIKRVGIHYNQASSHCAKHNDRVLADVRHLHRDAVARFQVCLVLQPGCKVAALGVEVTVSESCTNSTECGTVGKLFDRLLEYIHHAFVLVQVHLTGHAGGVFILIELLKIHHHLLFGAFDCNDLPMSG